MSNSLQSILQNYYVSNDISPSLITKVPERNHMIQIPSNDCIRKLCDAYLLRIETTYNGLVTELGQSKLEDLEWKDDAIQSIIDELKITEDQLNNKQPKRLMSQILIQIFDAFHHVQQIKLIRRLYNSSDDIHIVIRDWSYFKRSMSKIFQAILNYQRTQMSSLGSIFAFRLSEKTMNGPPWFRYLDLMKEDKWRFFKPTQTIEDLSRDGSILQEKKELAVMGYIRDRMTSIKLDIPDVIGLLINQFHPGLTFYDKIKDLIKDKLNCMDIIDGSISGYQLFLNRFNDENINFYATFKPEITGVYARYGRKLKDKYLSNHPKNPSIALQSYSIKVQTFYNRIEPHLTELFKEKVLSLFVDTISTQYGTGYSNMIVDIEDGYEHLDNDLKSDLVRIYTLFKMLDAREARKINQAFKRHI